LERTAVVQPLIEAGGFPDGVEVKADGVAGRNNSTGNDVVAVQQGTCNRLTDAVDVDRGCCVGSRRRGWFAARDVARSPLNLII